ncbi:unnamed protein product [Adineta steineri]|uniref:Uncharacterized protein n=1 Tax=Adineta steineri TaxID=433720 RepID=A0A818T042_9BILA|nr:unnamed protein product [Adineta steineri]CAF3677160.1 unnamed protein product [Adineta steineri]
MLNAPACHPLQTLQNLWFAIRHPICTANALIKWIKQNKWRAGIIIVCGLVIGVGAGILIGGPLLVGALAVEVAGGVTGGLITFGAVGIMPLLAAAGEGGVLVKEADRQIADEENKNKTAKQAVLDEVDPMKRKVRNEEFLRSRLREAKRQAEQELAVIIRAEQESAQLLDQQLINSSHEQIASALGECEEALAVTAHELTETRDARERIIVVLNGIQHDHCIINNAQEAAIRIQKSSKDTFTLIGVGKETMNLDGMTIEAHRSDYTWILNSCIISFIVLIFAVILYWFPTS